jgi:hypothetical protein
VQDRPIVTLSTDVIDQHATSLVRGALFWRCRLLQPTLSAGGHWHWRSRIPSLFTISGHCQTADKRTEKSPHKAAAKMIHNGEKVCLFFFTCIVHASFITATIKQEQKQPHLNIATLHIHLHPDNIFAPYSL